MPLAELQERILAHADVDERRLHARQDVLHPTFVDVAEHLRILRVMNIIRDEHAVLNDRRSRLLLSMIDQNFFHREPLNLPQNQTVSA